AVVLHRPPRRRERGDHRLHRVAVAAAVHDRAPGGVVV
ncbi:MAG: hypothetical protein AVDCRST_MAG66-3112, partial [uncultured Pseudonocardia sp.]